MFLPHRLYQPLATLDPGRWQAVLERHAFWKERRYACDDEHQGLAFHILMSEGRLATDLEGRPPSPFEFDAVAIPRGVFDDGDLCDLVQYWADMHAENFGTGLTVKMGLYVVSAGGCLGYHIDGPVFLKGQRVDLSTRDVQRGLVEVHCSRRTILPLCFNEADSFLVCGHRVPLRRGELFEFSNVLPHAYENKGSAPAVMLVTTYLVEDLIPVEFPYG